MSLDVVRSAIEHPDQPVKKNIYTCSFCHKTSDQVVRVFRSPATPFRDSTTPDPACICNECVTRMYTWLNKAQGKAHEE